MDGSCYSQRGARNSTRNPHFNQWDYRSEASVITISWIILQALSLRPLPDALLLMRWRLPGQLTPFICLSKCTSCMETSHPCSYWSLLTDWKDTRAQENNTISAISRKTCKCAGAESAGFMVTWPGSSSVPQSSYPNRLCRLLNLPPVDLSFESLEIR